MGATLGIMLGMKLKEEVRESYMLMELPDFINGVPKGI